MADRPAGAAREILKSVDSTNAEALRRAAGGEAGPLWLLALEQTQGRGRRGRSWAGADGNFYASLLSQPAGGPAAAALRSFTAALGLFDALVQVTGRPELFAVKWPNDVLLSGRKLAGILLESANGRGGGPVTLVTGIGVNLAHAPKAAALEADAVPPVSLAEATGLGVGPEEFLGLLAPAVQFWEDRLAGEGFEPVRAAWLARAARLGEVVIARLPGREVTGRFETIDTSGAIVLMTSQGRVSLPAADIHFAAQEK